LQVIWVGVAAALIHCNYCSFYENLKRLNSRHLRPRRYGYMLNSNFISLLLVEGSYPFAQVWDS
jgi:hypothetical protein